MPPLLNKIKERIYKAPVAQEKSKREKMFFFVIFIPKNDAEIYTPKSRVKMSKWM